MSAHCPPDAGARDASCLITPDTVKDLGVLPSVVSKVNELAATPETTADQMAALILTDPTLTSKILRTINSAFYGLRQEVSSIRHAVSYLGLHQVRNLVISGALIEGFRFDHGIIDPRSVWEHSLGCAIASKRVGDQLSGVDGDSAYLGGLLHDLGRIIMLSQFPGEYAEVVSASERGLCSLRDTEVSRFGDTHASVGAMAAGAWGFADNVQQMIRFHHDPTRAGEYTAMAATVGFTNALCHRHGLRFGFALDDDHVPEEEDGCWDAITSQSEEYASLSRREVTALADEALKHTPDLIAQLF